MTEPLAARAGSAIIWSAVQLVGTRIVSLVRFLILARLLAPEEFGLLAIAAVAVELLIALSKVGASDALVQLEDPDDRHYDTAWTLGLLRGAAIGIGAAVLAPLLASAFGEPAATPFLRVLGLRPLIEATSSIRLITLSRSLRFRPLAMVRVSAAAMEAVSSILLMLLIPALVVDAAVAVSLASSLGAWALVAGSFAGTVLGVVVSYVITPYRPRLSLDRTAARTLLTFGKWLFAASVFGVVGHVLLRAVISRRLGTADLGIFYLGVKLTLLPNDVAGEVVRSVAFPLVSRVKTDAERARQAFQGALKAMLTLLVPAYALMFALSEPLVEHILGSTWQAMVPVIQILALDGIVDIVADSTKPLLLGLGHPERRALLKGVRTLVILILAWPLSTGYGLAGAAAAWLAAELVQSGLAVVVASRSLQKPFAGMGRPVVAIIIASGGSASVAWLLQGAIGGIGGMMVGIPVAIILAAVTMYLLDRFWQLGITADLGRAFPTLTTRLGLTSETV